MRTFIFQAVLTPDEGGGFNAHMPDLPGCFGFGDTYVQAVHEVADAMQAYLAAALKSGGCIPEPTLQEVAPPAVAVFITLRADEDYLIEGEVVSAAEASRRLGVSAGRVTHMLDAGVLEGYRRGRRTFVTVESIDRRKASKARAGRPRKKAEA